MNLRKLFYSVRYTDPSQLLARIELLTKRKFFEVNSVFFNKRFKEKEIHAEINTHLAGPIFKAGKGRFSEESKNSKSFILSFLNESRSFQLPINWHEKELEYGTRLWKLNLHYMEFLEEVDNDWFQGLVEDWIEQNLPYKERYWLDSWNSFALSIRVVVWMQQIALRKDSLDTDFINKATISVYKQLLFLEKNIEKDIKGNHIIKNIKALLWGASFFRNDNNVRRWVKLGTDLLQKELHRQILPDGMHYERSPSYHIQVFADLMECYCVLQKGEAVRTSLENKLGKMAQVVADLKHPDGLVAQFNDGGLKMTYSPKEVLAIYSDLFEERIHCQDYFQYSEAGYYGIKNENNYIVFDAGKIGPDELPGHGHGDIFSFEWSVGGKRIIIDKGTYEYNDGKKRRESRSTLSHNTVNIAHEDQCEFWKAFRVARRADVKVEKCDCFSNRLSVKASHDGYKRLKNGPVHEREFIASYSNINITDKIYGGEGYSVEARLLFHPNCSVTLNDGTCEVKNGNSQIHIDSDLSMELIETSWFPDFGKEVVTKQLIINYGYAPCEGKISLKQFQ